MNLSSDEEIYSKNSYKKGKLKTENKKNISKISFFSFFPLLFSKIKWGFSSYEKINSSFQTTETDEDKEESLIITEENDPFFDRFERFVGYFYFLMAIGIDYHVFSFVFCKYVNFVFYNYNFSLNFF